MINYFVTAEHRYTIDSLIKVLGKKLPFHVNVVSYRELQWKKVLNSSAFIFSDLERLGGNEKRFASAVHKSLASKKLNFFVLNDPSRVKCRYDLLKTLFKEGVNAFNVYRITGSWESIRYPVFLRRENDHGGSLTHLLKNSVEVEKALFSLEQEGVKRKDLLITEFCDTSDQTGIYRKYSALRIGDRIIPRHVFKGKNWVLKFADKDCLDDKTVREEWDYLVGNPHEKELKKIFDLAEIDFGRIDYSMLGEKMQVWEINTNPSIASAISFALPSRKKNQEFFLNELISAFQHIPIEPSKRIHVDLPSNLRFNGFSALHRMLASIIMILPIRTDRKTSLGTRIF